MSRPNSESLKARSDGIFSSPMAAAFMTCPKTATSRSTPWRLSSKESQRAHASGRSVRFSVTTNATMLTDDDIHLVVDHDFQVAISIDGPKSLNDAQRPLNGGGSAYDRVLAALDKFGRLGRPRHLSARATVAPGTGPLRPILDHLIGLGFDSVGFSPILVSPNPMKAFSAADFESFCRDMIACGIKAKQALLDGRSYPF